MANRLDKAIDIVRRHSSSAALMFMSLDGFKAIHDELGHFAGDAVLQLVARRLESGVRDSGTVSRHGVTGFLCHSLNRQRAPMQR